jgi:purine-binding chemotaxis protein CheW
MLNETSQPYLILRLRDTQLAVSSLFVGGLFVVPRVTPVPGQPADLRGVMNIRGQILPLLDLRIRCGMPSYVRDSLEEIDTLYQREQDHRNWLAELRNSVREKRPFTLARDPHQCKFGRWYDAYQPMHQEVGFLSLWRGFNAPHCRIHALADEVCDLASHGDYASALAIIEAAEKTDLGALVAMFESARTLIREETREVAVIIEAHGRRMAICADEVLTIRRVSEGDMVPLPVSHSHGDALFSPQAIPDREGKRVWPILDSRALLSRAA